jgi:hypothetical protein
MRAFRLGLVLVLVATMAGPVGALPKSGAGKPKNTGPAVESVDVGTQIDVNRIGMFVTNVGSFGFDLPNSLGGVEFPRGTGKTALFAGGLWLGAKVDGETRVALAEYSQDFVPGPMVDGTFVQDNPQFRVFKVSRSDTTGYGAWMAIAVPMGAPTDSTGTLPGIIGDQTLWSVYNDADPDNHIVQVSDPLGVEVQQTTFAFDRQGPLGNTIFMKFKIINKGTNTLDSMFVSIWSDPDLGGFTDDLVGIDVPRSLGYVYNASNNDDVYGTRPPALGFDYFQGPLSDNGVDRLPVTAFVKYINGTDPTSKEQVYNYQLGLEASGEQLVNPSTGLVTTFQHSGDPVTNTGWLDTNPADRRMFLSSGPFTMAPGDTQEVVCAMIIGEGRDRLSAITGLRVNDDVAQDAFNRGFDLPTPPPQPVVTAQPLDRAVVLTWGRDSEVPDPVFGYQFEGYNVYQGATATGPWEKIATFDVANGVDVISDSVFNASTGTFVFQPVQVGTNSGLQYSITITQDAIRGGQLNNGTAYHYAVTAYNYRADPPPKFPTSLETSQQSVTVIPQRSVLGTDLSLAGADVPVQGQVVVGGATTSDVVEVSVVDPTRVTGHDYEIFYTPIVGPPPIYDGQPVPIYWNLRDVTTGEVLLSNQVNRTGNEDYEIVDGLLIKVIGANTADQLQDVRYIQVSGSGDPELAGVDWGGIAFQNGAGYAEGFHDLDNPVVFHSSLNPVTNADQFSTVEVRFAPTDTSGQQKAYRYIRDEVPPNGDAPATGRGYYYGGFVDVPFSVWDTQGDLDPGNDVQLDAFFVERRLTDAAGTPLADSLQLPTFNSTWLPDRSLLGSREYLFVARSTYTATEKAAYAVNDPFHAVSTSSPLAPLTYVAWARKNTSISRDPIDNGDMLKFIWAEPATPNDRFTFSTSAALRNDAALAKSQLGGIRVVPNPYYSHSSYEASQFARVIRFMNLPARCKVRIFTLAGQLVRTLEKDDASTSILDWDVQTQNQLPVASGIYIFQVEADGIGRQTGRLAVFMETERLNNF